MDRGMNARAVDAWLAERGVPERITAADADAYTHAFSVTFGGGKPVRSPFRHRHPRVSIPRTELAQYLARRAAS